MAFAGGPFNNFVLQATVAVAERLREERHALGVVTTVSGLLTKPGMAVWSAVPDGRPPLVGDLAGEAAVATEAIQVDDVEQESPEERAVWQPTVGQQPWSRPPSPMTAWNRRAHWRCVDRPDGRRTVAMSDDRSVAAHVVAHGLAGQAADIVAGALRLG